MPSQILVVDDDHKVLEILEETLTREGHEVQVASNGMDALVAYKQRTPDLVVLDVSLPDMDGRDVFRQIRALKEHSPAPVLFLSASSDADTRLSTFERGAEDFLIKPVSLKELKFKVEKVLDNYEKRRILEEKKSDLLEHKENKVVISKELKKQLLSMRTLFTVSQDLNRQLDIDELINRFSLTIVGELQISNMAVFTLRNKNDELFTLHGVKGFDRSRIEDLKLRVDGEFAKWLFAGEKPQKIVRSKDKNWVRRLPDVRLAVFEYVSPIIVKHGLSGIVFTGPKISGGEYSSFDLDMLRSVCNSAGIGIDNARLFAEIQNTYLSTVKTLVSLIEAKDAYTKGHTERVADYAIALGRNLGLSKGEVRDLAFGAVLHDIGKLMIYEKVLNKPGSLTSEEWELLKKHPEVGASIIQNIDFLSGTVSLVLHHHENYDGSGYPKGLKGDDIPIGARIISVTDAFDAMTTDRSYRKALSWDESMSNLRRKSGTQFDPKVVEAFIKLVERDGFRPRKFEEPVIQSET